MRIIGSLDDAAEAVGSELGVSAWFAIDQSRVDAFADVTIDHQWIHVDVDRAHFGPRSHTATSSWR